MISTEKRPMPIQTALQIHRYAKDKIGSSDVPQFVIQTSLNVVKIMTTVFDKTTAVPYKMQLEVL